VIVTCEPKKLQELVQEECRGWRSKGVNIKYEVRDNRNGYKAGALKEGMKHSHVLQCEYVAIFDADFQPEPDFLLRAIPFLVNNPELGLVQARWKFGNFAFFSSSRIALTLIYETRKHNTCVGVIHKSFEI